MTEFFSEVGKGVLWMMGILFVVSLIWVFTDSNNGPPTKGA